MKKTITLALALLFSPLASASQSFGQAFDFAKSGSVTVAQVLAKPAEFLQQPFTVQGKIDAVCQKKGCWMQLSAGGNKPLKIKVRDGDMEFPMSARGKQALATGQLVKIELDLESSREQLAAQAKEQGKSFDPSTVTSAVVNWQLVPTAVEILH